jgi:hypothetical protein
LAGVEARPCRGRPAQGASAAQLRSLEREARSVGQGRRDLNKVVREEKIRPGRKKEAPKSVYHVGWDEGGRQLSVPVISLKGGFPRMTRRWGLIAAMPAAVAGIGIATLGAHAGTAGQPTPQSAILCGLYMPSDGVDNVSGQSAQDHVDGADVSGGQYYTPDATHKTCQDEYNNGNFNSGTQTFTWKVNHSNVDVNRERGTEHGQFVLSGSSAWEAGFQGQIFNYDFATPLTSQDTQDTAPGENNSTLTLFYQSGHPGGAGNFNTHGGAATGQHYRGTYGVTVYQDNTMGSPCQPGSSNYCFQALLDGQVN